MGKTKVYHPKYGVGEVTSKVYESASKDSKVSVTFESGSVSVPKSELRMWICS